MSGPTRFQFGVTNVPSRHPLGNLQVPFSLYTHQYQNDFDQYVAADWTLAAVGAGTAALVAGNGGVLALTTTAASSDSTSITKLPAAFGITAGLQAGFMARVNIDSMAQNSTWQIGMQAGGSAFAPVDGIYFTKAAAATTLVANMRKAGVSSTVSMGTNLLLATAAFVVVGWYYDGRNAGVNGAKVTFFAGTSTTDDPFDSISAYFTSIQAITDMTNLPIVNLAPSIGVQTNTANARVMNVDYVVGWADLAR